MEVPDLISKEVWEKAKRAFENQEHWVSFNNTLLFVHETDIRFFTNKDDADDFCFDNHNEVENWQVSRINDLNEFKTKVESIMPGLVYKPIEEMAIVQEMASSFFPKELLLKNKTIIMNAENLEYLKNQLLFLGFGEGLNSKLESKMKEGKPEFTLDASTEFGTDKMQAVIHFRHSEKDGKEAYFCNHYISTLLREDQNRSQFIYVNNKGQNVTFKESCNLLNSRSVFKEVTPREGAAYKAWLKIDHENNDQKTGFPKLRQFTTNYGFDLKEAVGRMDFKGMKYDDNVKGLLKSLQKGNAASVLLMKDGKELPVKIEANPQLRTLNMYDKNGEKLFYPMQKVEQKYRQAPADVKKLETASVVNESGKEVKYEKKNLLEKNKPSNGLLPKKNAKSKSQSRKIS
ncbi:MAG: hypothetical protein K2Q21_08020 [Chitinophagaceae bacterium]|nr:hypothetical protein [Chitinophagaceae bacterium]